MKNKNQRIAAFDIAKALVMFFVVAGHSADNGIVARCSTWAEPYWGNILVGISMPMFFMISGNFSMSSLVNGSIVKIVARIVSLLWPLAAFGVVFGAVIACVGELPLWKVALFPLGRIAFGGWFLLAIAIIYALCAAIAVKIGKNDAQRIFLLFLLWLIVLVLPRGMPFHWTKNVVNMFPYFVFGMYILRRYEPYKKVGLSLGCGVVFAAIIIAESLIGIEDMSFYRAKIHWSDLRSLFFLTARTLTGITGCIFVLFILDVLCKRFVGISKLAVFGTTTLGIYVIHEWPMTQIKAHGVMVSPIPACYQYFIAAMIFFGLHYFMVFVKKHMLLNDLLFGNERSITTRIDNFLSSKFHRMKSIK